MNIKKVTDELFDKQNLSKEYKVSIKIILIIFVIGLTIILALHIYSSFNNPKIDLQPDHQPPEINQLQQQYQQQATSESANKTNEQKNKINSTNIV